MSTVSPVRTRTVSFQTRFGSTTSSRSRIKNRLAVLMILPVMAVLGMASASAVLPVFLGLLVCASAVILVAVTASGCDQVCGHELHAAFRAAVRLLARHLRMHRTHVCRLFCRLSE